jgi:hypothetical protein
MNSKRIQITITNRTEEVENNTSEIGDKIQELDQPNKDKEKD